MRATLRLSSPAWLAQPRITSLTSRLAASLRARSASIARAARSSGRIAESAPRCLPKGERTPSRMTASMMVGTYQQGRDLGRRRSTAREAGLPLLVVGADALLRVLALEEALLQLPLEREPLL